MDGSVRIRAPLHARPRGRTVALAVMLAATMLSAPDTTLAADDDTTAPVATPSQTNQPTKRKRPRAYIPKPGAATEDASSFFENISEDNIIRPGGSGSDDTATSRPTPTQSNGTAANNRAPVIAPSTPASVFDGISEKNIIRPSSGAAARPLDVTKTATDTVDSKLGNAPMTTPGRVDTVPAYTDIRDKTPTDTTATNESPDDAKAPKPGKRRELSPMENALRTVAAHKLATIPGGTQERVDYALGVAATGDIVSARTLCDVLLEQAQTTGRNIRLVEDCLEFGIPVEQLRGFMQQLRMRNADSLVDELLANPNHSPEQRQYLANIKKVTGPRAASEDPRRSDDNILEIVKLVLGDYHEETGRFPLSYAELNRVLPADAPPLEDYDIIEYSGSKNHFTVQLRSRENPGEVLSLHQASLLE